MRACVAVIQAASVIMDKAGSTAKAVRLVEEAAGQGARLVLLPESFIPCYPRGFDFGLKVGSRQAKGRALFARYAAESVLVPGPETAALGDAARRTGVHLAVGVTERVGSTLYCTVLQFSAAGALVHVHRKLKPTGLERVIWGEGDGSGLGVIATPLGRIGTLVCWENYMPLARAVLYEQGVQLYLAPTADARDAWQASLRHIACEGRCFVLGSNQFVTQEMYPRDLPGIEELSGQDEVLCRGGSAIVSPYGDYLAGPLWDGEGLLLAELDLDELPRARFDFDAAGHYARPDVLRLVVNRSATRHWPDETAPPADCDENF